MRNSMCHAVRADLAIVFALTVYSLPAAAQLPPVPVPAENPITEPKRVLGKMLFWDEQLSSDNTIACGTCHLPTSAGADPRTAVNPGVDGVAATLDDIFGSFGVARADSDGEYYEDAVFGFARQVTGRSAQMTIGSQWAPDLFWDGRATSQFINPETGAVSIAVGGGLESQAVGPIMSDVEMAHEDRDWSEVSTKLSAAKPMALAVQKPADVQAALAGVTTYGDLFTDAFGDPAITAERIAFAIATYERTLVADQTPWDAFVGGNPTAMTPGQVQGWNFFRASQCAICHAPPLFTNNTFRNIGLRPLAEDTGRQGVTGVPADAGRFKVPSLRNTGLKSTYMHNGQLQSLPVVLDFYQGVNGQVQFPANQDPLIPPINIPPPVRPALVDFLANALTDPRVEAGTFPFDRPKLHSELLEEMSVLTDCVNGPGALPAPTFPTTQGECLSRFDMDGDSDVDLTDYTEYQLANSQ
ncbi:MAG TPA: cytochrome c peroxidase [Phycisphaerae bacterium]|nr:cytochrome c peroxidase [Phycisphaerae bacterium]